MNIETLKNLEQDKPYLLVFLDTLTSKKSLNYHDLLLSFQNYFEQINVNVYIVTPDLDKDIEDIKSIFHSNFIYLGVQAEEIYFEFDAYKEKNVFGKTYKMISLNMCVIYEEKIVKMYKRLNHEMLKKVISTMAKIQFEIFLKKFKKNVDMCAKL